MTSTTNSRTPQNSAKTIPLVVDLDGTLTPTDTLLEGTLQVIKQAPLNFLRLPFWLLEGRAAFKHRIAGMTSIAATNLPYRQDFLAYLRQEHNSGRKIILATAANRLIAHDVASYLGLFNDVLASDSECNLKGPSKLAAIKNMVGEEFVYAGDSRADIPIWNASSAAILVGASRSLTNLVRSQKTIEREFPKETISFFLWMKAFRTHQWLKNLLLFVPLITAFSFTEYEKLVTMVIAFLSFSLAASATYIANDFWDLENDRAHARKKMRPFASGQIPILAGITAGCFLLLFAFALAIIISKAFVLMLTLYLILTSAYSWVFKEYVLIDVIMLSLLYTLRILTGAAAIEVATSHWLLAFSVFMFLSLALVKRCSELVFLEQSGKHATRGRDYRTKDLVILWPLGVGASLSSVVVFGLFINAPETQGNYASPSILWLIAIGLIYWTARLWIKTVRGEMHDDPVIYAVKDFGSRVTVFAMIVIMLLGHFLPIESIL